MSTKLPPPPIQAALTDEKGMLSSVWADFIKQMFNRTGKNTALSNTELAAKFPLQSSDLGSGVVAFSNLLGSDWTKSAATSGYQKLPSGLYIQWGVTGSIAGPLNSNQTFPVAFPTACLQVIPGIQGNSAGVSTATGHFGTGNYSATGFTLFNRTSAAYTFNYLAVGY